jgi:phosphoribosylanthranilate isomerase
MPGNELKRAAASMEQRETVQVKVCGLTRVEEAVACAQAGARAVGCVFYAKSPRCVTAATARAIRRALR